MNKVFEHAGDLVNVKVAHNLMRLIAEGFGEDDDAADSQLRSSAVCLLILTIFTQYVSHLAKCAFRGSYTLFILELLRCRWSHICVLLESQSCHLCFFKYFSPHSFHFAKNFNLLLASCLILITGHLLGSWRIWNSRWKA